ncbi:MAG: bifunctional glutamate N-acetyltransferase/amino-acid acetyltransferase ArgJ [Actinobacteria bacterium]|jgi:glutamate N-acetyltransferase/amino-acid N-acetyltransferase|nr:bifunctional glutamate N-acetyltransferase/amino-acid acetyltransferase ArgJ [Actinomycetota bacterium]NDH12780.1 bifunctional glutamate N-acetyltransferase/amino-acid acetyltransferase ArgJ [Actinomycetota bacterium]
MNLPSGFSGAGVSAGLKSNDAKDLTVIVNQGPQYFGTAVFTTNKIVAAPVTWSMEVVRDNEVKAVILNSGGANACTGPDGFVDTHKTAEHVAELLSISASDVVVCSTGLIGVRLLMDRLLNGASSAIANLSNASLIDCATGIMTTDSKPKISTSEISGTTFTGIAKGAGMLAPSLATMLSVIMTDAIVDEYSAKLIFEKIVDQTFNRIDSDGCTSTNDTVLFLASGASGVSLPDAQLESALQKICSELSFQLIADAEGHSKIVSITTINALSESDAVAVGRACARNNLLKCALHGEDPNWGRILAAIGTTSATFDPYRIDVNLNGVQVCTDSSPGADRDLVDMSGEIIEIVIDLNMGSESATIMTNDLTAMYVHENSAYAT